MFTTLPFVVCLCWLVFLLLEWRRVSAATHMLTLFVSVSTMLYLCHALYFNGFSGISHYTDAIYAFCNIAVFPLYYLYICRLTQVGKLTKRQWSVLVPAFVIGIWSAVDLFCFSTDTALDTWRMNIAKGVFVVQLVFVAYCGWRKIAAFDHRIEEFYTDTENRAANMTSYIILVLTLCALISIVFSAIGRERFVGHGILLYIPSVLFTMCLYAVCYIGYRQSFTADDLAKDESVPQEEIGISEAINLVEATSTAQEADPTHNEFERLCKMIEDNRWYLRSDLRLPELAMLVGIGRTRLSTLINENSGMSFSDFINKYRIEYACRIFRESASDKEIVLAAIGEQCGFMSDSPFYRNFKKFTGMTPAQYRERYGQEGKAHA